MASPGAGYLFLDAVTSWQAAALSGLVETGTGRALALEPLPGPATPLFPKGAPPDDPSCPSAIAVEGCGRLLVADAARNRVERLDPRRGAVVPIASFGGLGSAPRRLREPRGIALTRSGGLVVSDSGNHRVQVFSRAPHALRYVWGAVDDRGGPVPGNGPGEFRWPWAVAAGPCGTVYVVDRGNRRVQVFDGDGRWLRSFGADVFRDPTRLALGPDGTIAVVDGFAAPGGRTSAVFLFPPGDDAPSLCIVDPINPRSVTFGGGRLYIGDAVGMIHVFDPPSATVAGYTKIGEGVTGLGAAIIDLAWNPALGLVLLTRQVDDTGVHMGLWRVDPSAGYIHTGTLATGRLDSGLDHCHWHRFELDAKLPTGTKLVVQALISNDGTVAPASGDGALALKPADLAAWSSWTLTGDDPDLLFPSGDAGTGRYLWLRVTFQSGGGVTPSLASAKVHYPRASYLQYLPAVYQEDDESRLFLERFLSIFQTELDGFDDLIDTTWLRLLDPRSADAKFLPWLAGWLALTTDPTWDESTLRSMIKGAYASYRIRGTVAGLEGAVQAYGGVGWGKVLEHFRLRRWPTLSVAASLDGGTRLWSQNFYRRLSVGRFSQVGRFRLTGAPEPAVEALHWGANRFSVFFPADPHHVEEARQRVAAVVEREKPAHTQATLCPVFPRLRVGVQATVGVDSVVGGLSPLRLNRLATLGYDTVLPGSAAERQVQALGTSPRPRVGVSTKLL